MSNFYKSKKVLVIGGAGYVGSNLCKNLVTKGGEVISLDNYSSGTEANHHKGVQYIKGNAKDINQLIRIKPDVIFHLGEYSRVENSFKDHKVVWENNSISIFPVVEFCKKMDSKLVYSGSSTLFSLKDEPDSSNPYAWSKKVNVDYLNSYAKWFGLNYAISYFYNVYGKNEVGEGNYATVLGIFRERFHKNQKLPVVKPGTQKRNFTHIDDIISGLLIIGQKGKGDGYGIGAAESYSILELVNMIGSEIEFLPNRKGNRNSGILQTNKTKELGWRQTESLEKYIAENFK